MPFSNSCYTHLLFLPGIFEKNGSVSVDTSTNELMNASMSCQVADPINVTTYFIRSYTSKCRFWDTEKESWESNGCQVTF